MRTNPAFNLLFGPARDLTTADGFNAWRSLALGGFFAALMAIFIVTRNSRANEDSGQAELIASGVVGRDARLIAAVAMAWIASLGLGIFSFIVTLIFGGGAAASAALCATFTASGVVFAGVAAVTAQIGSFARTANSIAVTVLGACYLIRGYAGTSPDAEWAIWLSPLGWTQKVAPATGNNWWPLLACLGLAIVLVAVAHTLAARRDFGMGIIPPSPGPARGGSVASAFGLALRLHRGSIISWTIAFVVLGAVFGSLSSSIGDLIAHNPQMGAILAAGGGSEADLTFQFLLTLLKILGIIAAVYGVQIINRVFIEESEYRVEPLLAGALSRTKFYASHVAIALVGPAAALVIGGFMLGVTASAVGANVTIVDLVLQSIASVPAIWILIGIAVLVVGAKPEARLVSWFGVVATFVLTILGPTFNLWDWVLGISPLWHVPNVVSADANYLPLLWLTLIAAALMLVGFVGYRKRDLQYQQV